MKTTSPTIHPGRLGQRLASLARALPAVLALTALAVPTQSFAGSLVYHFTGHNATQSVAMSITVNDQAAGIDFSPRTLLTNYRSPTGANCYVISGSYTIKDLSSGAVVATSTFNTNPVYATSEFRVGYGMGGDWPNPVGGPNYRDLGTHFLIAQEFNDYGDLSQAVGAFWQSNQSWNTGGALPTSFLAPPNEIGVGTMTAGFTNMFTVDTATVGAPQPIPTQTYFTDSLATDSTSPNITIPAPKYQKIAAGLQRINNSTGGGDASSNNDRPMVSTRVSSYLSETQFKATVTLNLSSPDLAYFGFGQGVADSTYFNEPSSAFVFRVHRNWTGNSSIQVWPTQAGVGDNQNHFFGFLTGNGSLGTYGGGSLTLQIQRNGDSLTMSIPSTGASFTFSISQFAAPMGLNGTNTRIFFGATNNGSVFSNLSIVPGDTTPPVITAPADITAEATSASGATVNFSATATDNVDGPVAVVASPPSGSMFAIGTTAVGLAASDAAHNTASASFTVTVRDTIAPALTVPASQTLEATSAAGAAATFSASATDAVGVTSLTSSSASGSTFPLGTTTVTVTAKDAAGNTSSGSFSVTVRDTTAPVITSLGTNAPTLWPPNHKMVAVTVNAAASDLVGVASLKIVSVTSNEPDNGLGDGDTPNDIQITGNLTVNLRAERSGTGNGRTYTITVEARDAAGNASTKICTVSVPKSQGGK